MLSDASFSSAFVFSINSLILSSSSLTLFYLAEASLPASSWLYIFVYAVVKKYQKKKKKYFIYTMCKIP